MNRESTTIGSKSTTTIRFPSTLVDCTSPTISSKPTKHLIARNNPQLTTIPPKGFLVLWADDQITQGVLHLGFKLERSGEQIGLAQSLDAGVVFIDSLRFAVQSTNFSYGRSPDGTGTWKVFTSPTPKASNQGPNDVAEEQPIAFCLMQNYPNPFNPSTTIRYGLLKSQQVSLTVFNTLGQQVAVLQNGEQDAGYHEVKFDGNKLASGVYLYRMQAGSYVETKKLLLVR